MSSRSISDKGVPINSGRTSAAERDGGMTSGTSDGLAASDDISCDITPPDQRPRRH
jgi:hypothetical protein